MDMAKVGGAHFGCEKNQHPYYFIFPLILSVTHMGLQFISFVVDMTLFIRLVDF
jgi:hypothetical protein